MQRVFLLAAAVGLWTAGFASAQSRPHLELVRGLRTNGLADLAMTYLDELKASNPPRDLLIVLPLEYARTRLALARMETDETKREQILTAARAEFDTFIKANPTDPQTPFAHIDLARLNGLRGKTLYSKARWMNDPMAKQAKMLEARKLFAAANEKYKSAIDAIDKQTNKTTELESLELAAKLDQAINLYDTSKTYDDSSDEGIKRGDDLTAAKKILEKIMVLNDKDPVAWVARAWMAQLAFETDDVNVAKNELDNILLKQRNNPKAQAGVRVAQYFRIFQNSDKIPVKGDTPQSRIQRTIDDATNWLSTYRSFRNSPEGLGALFARATKRLELSEYGLTWDKANKNKLVAISPNAMKLMEEAEKDFKELSESENEYAEQSNLFRTRILVRVADQLERTGDITPEALGTFEKCYLEAQIQYARMMQFVQKKPEPKKEDIEAEEKRRYRTATRFLEYAIAHATPSDPIRDVFNAQTTLIAYYYRQHLYQQAAILAEHVTRSNPRAVKALLMAQNAMECYRQSYLHAKAKAGAAPEDFDADLERMRDMARYIVSTWPDAPGSDGSRHMLASQLARDPKTETAAVQLYQAIRPSYSNLTQACLEMSSVMFKIVRPVDETDPIQFNHKAKDNIGKYQAMWDKTIQMLATLPAPDEEAADVAIKPYVTTRSNLALLYQLQGRFEDAKKVGEALMASIGKWKKLEPTAKENDTFTAKTIIFNALRNECTEHSKQKNYAKVAEILNPLIEQMQKDFTDKKESGDAPKSFRDAQRQVIVIALQSAVQAGNIPRATELLDVLEKSGGSTEGNFGMMRSLAGTIRGQLDALRAELRKNPKDKEKAEEIEKLAKGFTEFLNQIAPKADQIKDEAGKVEMKIFLAQGYSSVDSYAEATKLLKPVRETLKTLKIADDQKAAIDRKKKQVDFALVHGYRLGKQYDDAEAIFKEIIGPTPPGGKGPPPAASRGWGYNSPAVRKERALLKEDVALAWNKASPTKAFKWSEAFAEWAEIKKSFAEKIPPRVDEKEVAYLKELAARKIYPRYPAIEGQPYIVVGGVTIADTNPMTIALRDKVRAKVEDGARKRAIFFDIFIDQAHCFLKAYHALDPVKYEPQIAKVAQSMAEFHAKNSDLSPEHLERMKAIADEYPKTFGPKYREADAELSPKAKK